MIFGLGIVIFINDGEFVGDVKQIFKQLRFFHDFFQILKVIYLKSNFIS